MIYFKASSYRLFVRLLESVYRSPRFSVVAFCIALHSSIFAQVDSNQFGSVNTDEIAPRLVPAPPATLISTMIEARVVSTDNAGPDASGVNHSDIMVEVQPSILVERRSRTVKLQASAAFGRIIHATATQPNQTLKRGRFDISTELVDNLIYLDGWARVDPSLQDSLASRADAATSYQLSPLRRFSFSPSLRKSIGDSDRVAASSTFTATRYSDIVTRSQVTSKRTENIFSFEHQPTPFGYSTQITTETESNGLSEARVLDTTAARQWVLFSVSEQLSLGVVGGYERIVLPNGSTSDKIYGMRSIWKPTERTNIDIDVESRYFGNGWETLFAHHTPAMALDFSLSKKVSSQQSPGIVFSRGQNVAEVLNAILATRFTDPGARQREVDRIVSSNGLPEIASDSTTVYSLSAQVRQSASFQIGFLGQRNILYFSYGYLKQAAFELANQTLPATSDYDTILRDFSASLNTKITPFVSSNILVDWSRLERTGGSFNGQYSAQLTLRGELAFILSPRSTSTVGLRRLSNKSNFLSTTDLQARNAFYAGLLHRF
jgi:uncharacterized protein (PEP-CTERM system associated)